MRKDIPHEQRAIGRDESRETVTVRYWAGARAAAGTAEDTFEVDGDLTLADLVALVLERHPDDRMARTVAVCSVLARRPAGALAGPGDGGRRARARSSSCCRPSPAAEPDVTDPMFGRVVDGT